MSKEVHAAAMGLVTAIFDRPLIQNSFRGAYVEALVETALGNEWRKIEDWGGWDFEHSDGTRLEVKQSALKQSWIQGVDLLARANGSFSIREAKGHYEDNVWKPTSGRLADMYVFAWHGVADDHSDHRDVSQWQFFVIPAAHLPLGQKSIGVRSIKRLGEPVSYAELSGNVMDKKLTIRPTIEVPSSAFVQGGK